jgi:peptide/nickel transport system ATP-binding protein
MSDSNGAILEVEGLKKYFPIERGMFHRAVGQIKAVDDVSFTVKRGETFGLVGESGCGKTTTARVILRAYEPTAGRMTFRPADGQAVDLAKADKETLYSVRDYMHMIFQDPYASLNPRMTVEQIIGEPMIVRRWEHQKTRERVEELLTIVGLDPTHMLRYPHAFSGGQRQRIGIARALALNPSLVVADEAVSALDVSVQAQIINLLEDLQEQLGLTYLFIAHDLSVVRHITDSVAVMYLGKIVETTATRYLFEKPIHPYTSMLLAAVPVADPRHKGRAEVVRGEVTQAAASAAGCSFANRCPFAVDRCREEEPPLVEYASHDGVPHLAACHRAAELDLPGID